MSTLNFTVYKVVGLCTLLFGLVAIQPANASESRIALLIGNADYKSASVLSLNNPLRDAAGMREVLQKLGFQVLRLENANQASMEKAFHVFGQKIKADASTHDNVVALFYYSGHGAQVNGKNYLLSINSNTDYDVTDNTERSGVVPLTKRGVVPLTKLFKELNAVETENTTNIIILDACRDNPTTQKLEIKNTKNAMVKGLESLDEAVTAANDASGVNTGDPSNTIFAYATASGKVAEEGYGLKSPYTQHLISLIGERGMAANELFKQVAELVKQDTSNRQQPWQYSSLLKNFYFKSRRINLRGGGFLGR